MRYLWSGALVSIALLGAACSSSPDNTLTSTTVHHRTHHRRTTTTTTTAASRSTAPTTTLASGPEDKLACASFATLGQEVGKGHKRIATAFQRLFRDLRRAENTKLRQEGHEAAKELLQDDLKRFKLSFTAIYVLCQEMK